MFKVIKQTAPSRRCKTQVKAFSNFTGKASIFSISYHFLFCWGFFQLRLIKLTHLLHQITITLHFRIHWPSILIVHHTNARLTSHHFYRFYKIQMIKLHYKINGITIFTTTKTMIVLFVGNDGERRSLFIMKRTARLVIFACFFKWYAPIN